MKARAPGCLASLAISLRTLAPSRFKAFALVLLATSALSGLAYTQSDPKFDNRNWDVSVWAAGATGEEGTNSFSEAQIVTGGIFVGRTVSGEIGRGWRRGSFEYGADFVPVFVQFAAHRASGTAFDPLILRWNSGLHRGRVSSFLDLGGGGVHTNHNFPQGNTSTFNFIARGGGGILIATKPAQALEIGCRWGHISNANLGTQNPEFNGIQVSLGWHWFK